MNLPARVICCLLIHTVFCVSYTLLNNFLLYTGLDRWYARKSMAGKSPGLGQEPDSMIASGADHA